MKKYISAFILITCVLFTGCSSKNTDDIVEFQTKINTVVTKMEAINDDINNITVSSPDAPKEVLSSLSELNDAFQTLAEIEITDENFEYLESLADEGAEYMAQAYGFFKEAYTAEVFDPDSAELAYQYLERASKRARIMIELLHGEMPDGVTITTES